MPRERKTYQVIISIAVFILLETVSVIMLRHNGQLQDIWISRISHTVMGKVWGGSDNLKQYFSLSKQNEALADENFHLRSELDMYHAMEAEQRRDSLTAGISANFQEDFIMVPATIVKMSRNSQHNYFIINKGSEDGVRPQSGVITGKGVIGIIDAVDKHCSYGLSLMNSGVSISARLGTEGAVGPLTWNGRSKSGAVLKEIPLQFKFEKGDTVWTSGYSAIFPPDIPLGVTGDTKIVNGAVNEISVELFENFSALRYVTVVENAGRDEILNLESLESGDDKKDTGKK